MTQTQAQPTGFLAALGGGNPYPAFAALRKNSPVLKIDMMGGAYAVSRYEDVTRILRDPDNFSSVVGVRSVEMGEENISMLFNDPPMHTRLRGLISRAFTPRVVEQQRGAIEAYCDTLLDRLCASDEADIVLDLAYPLPVQVIANMMGVADGDMATFKRWSDDIIENLGNVLFSGDDSQLAETNIAFNAYFIERLEKLRRDPEENLLSELVHVETEDGRLTEEELLMFCRLLLVAGNETTTGLIVNSVRAFSEFPEVYERVRTEPDLLTTALEESLRYYAPFPMTIRRAAKDVEVAGTTIPQNSRILVMLSSANRDETVFPDPDTFDPERSPNRHVSFGLGIHYCVGAPLARLEAQIAVEKLGKRVKAISIGEVEPGTLMRPGGPKSLKVTLERV